jgi:hypothetical protein
VLLGVQGHSTSRQEGQLEACQSFISTLIAGLRLDISVGCKDKLSGVQAELRQTSDVSLALHYCRCLV